MNRTRMTAAAALAVAAASLAAPARAEEDSSWRFSGYGTVGAVVTDTDDVQYRSSLRHSHGATTTPDFGVDSRLGAQLNYRLNSTFSAVAQGLVIRRDGSEKPRVEWLYGQAELGGDAALRVGRLVLPVFLFSDTRNVGFAQHWLRTPGEVYLPYPPSNFDGAQLQWRPRLADINFTVQVSAGRAMAHMYMRGMDIKTNFDDLRSLNLMAESGNWTYRLGMTQTRSGLMVVGLGPLGKPRDKFNGVGVQYDDGTWLLMSEFATRRQSGGGFFDSNSYYVSGGHRFGAWLPYVTFGNFTPRGAAYGTYMKAGVTSVGVRWDVRTNMALKAQWEAVRPGSQSIAPPGTDVNTLTRYHTLGVAADFVF